MRPEVRRIAAIVEGHGEVAAVPVLLRRIAAEAGVLIATPRPIRLPRGQMLIEKELHHAIGLAAGQAGDGGAVIILLDANSDCPATLGPLLGRRASAAHPDRPIRVVLAKVEYEAWFLAAAASLAGHRGIRTDFSPPVDPETVRDAKGLLSAQMPRGVSYKPAKHQAALSAIFDLNAARSAPSFDKFWRDVSALLNDPALP